MMEEIKEEPMDATEESEEDDSSESENEEEMDEKAEDDENEANGTKSYAYLKPLKEGEELVPDQSAYRMLHYAQSGAPCLSFDVIADNMGNTREEFPLSMFIVAGTQAAKTHVNNVLVMKMTNLSASKSDSDDESDESSDESDDESNSKHPVMSVAPIKHQGCINRIRSTNIAGTTLAASWSELGRVNLWNLDEQLKALEDKDLLAAYRKKQETNDTSIKPLFSFNGHLSEGFGLDWCPTELGTLASGDCKGNIHIWRVSGSSGSTTWHVDQRPYNSHAPHSVEDLQWSPTERNVLASCSVDKSIKIWDTRVGSQTKSMLSVSGTHTADINVISWNRHETQFLVSGGDDGLLCVWDLRQFSPNGSTPLATFKQHTAPVTTVEWHPQEATVFASGGADDQLAQWDLSLEVDETEETKTEQFKDLPPQLLFIHQGQKDIKELHWHPQCPGVVISTAHSGFNVFRTISV